MFSTLPDQESVSVVSSFHQVSLLLLFDDLIVRRANKNGVTYEIELDKICVSIEALLLASVESQESHLREDKESMKLEEVAVGLFGKALGMKSLDQRVEEVKIRIKKFVASFKTSLLALRS